MESNRENSNPAGGVGQESISAPAAQDAVGFLRRRKWLFVFVALPIILGTIVLAFRLPSIYQSEAKVLIEKPAIPEDIVATTITTYVDERIQAVSQRVLAADNVSMVVEEFNLYPELRVSGMSQTAIETFREDSELQNIAAEIFDARRGRMDGSTFAFVVGYRHSDPKVSQQVTSRLVQLYLDENVKSRTEISAETTRFLEQQAERVSGEISQIEQKLADFKAQNSGALPERSQLNIQLLDRTERDVIRLEDEIRQLTSERDMLRYELQGLSPYATMSADGGAPVMGAQGRLELLQLEYMRLTSTYGTEHPDVVRTKREIDAILGGESGQSADDITLRIAELRLERDQMRDRYSAEHPDVLRIERTIQLLESQRDVIARQSSSTSSTIPAPNNPLYVQKQLQIDGVNARLIAAQEERSLAVQRRAETEANIMVAPRIEKEWLELNRGYTSSREEFDEINMRISEARMSERIESQNKGERFVLLEGASLPSKPIEPNRFAIIFLGAVLAIGAGIGIAALTDGVDSTVRSSRDLELIYGASPLVSIPFIETASDRRVRWLRQTSVASIFILSIVAVIFSI
jgi:uncharacterized protein involved in exopolysaccharide biosynthesis